MEAKYEEIIGSHRKWLAGNPDGRRADLRGADLRGAVLSRADLSYADLRGALLSRADLSRADLRGIMLCGALIDGAIVGTDALQGPGSILCCLTPDEFSRIETQRKRKHAGQ